MPLVFLKVFKILFIIVKKVVLSRKFLTLWLSIIVINFTIYSLYIWSPSISFISVFLITGLIFLIGVFKTFGVFSAAFLDFKRDAVIYGKKVKNLDLSYEQRDSLIRVVEDVTKRDLGNIKKMHEDASLLAEKGGLNRGVVLGLATRLKSKIKRR
jgi:hypothetical protein